MVYVALVRFSLRKNLTREPGGEGGARIGHHIGDNPLQQIHTPHLVPLDDVLELDGVEQNRQILTAGSPSQRRLDR